MQFNTAQRELTLKIVYYGPGLSGKTTNLHALHQRIIPSLREHLNSLDTADERTLYFDMLPLVFRTGALKIKIRLFTVPGQGMHNTMRKLVLQGADAIGFIADSQPSKLRENYVCWQNMVDNLKANGLSIDTLPHVVQWNKKDLGDASTAKAIEAMKRGGKMQVFEAIAVQGEGVVETFLALADLAYGYVDRSLSLSQAQGLPRSTFLEAVRACLVHAPVAKAEE